MASATATAAATAENPVVARAAKRVAMIVNFMLELLVCKY
jgi:hypothetical protein